mgnify:CR=1 FL=1
MELNRKNVLKILGIIAFAILLFGLVQRFEAVVITVRIVLGLLSPILIGLALAFIINVPMSFIERTVFRNKKQKKWIKRFKRPISLIITILLILAIIAFIMLLVIPELAKTIMVLSVTIPDFLNNLEEWGKIVSQDIPGLTEWVQSLQNIKIDWEKISSTVWSFFQNGGGNMLINTFNAATTIFNGIFNAVLGIVFACYVLIQKEMLSRQIKRLFYAYLPEHVSDKIVEVCQLSNRTFANFLSGQCMEAVILGTLCFIGMSIFRFPYALMISVLVGALSIIPMFGAFIGVALGAFIILMVSPMQALWFIIFFIVLQQIEGNLIYPRVVGNSVGLPSVWVLFAATVGANMMGLVGLLIKIPLCSVIYTLLGEVVFKRLKKRMRTKKLPAEKLR